VTVRLLLDEMYPPALAKTLRDKGHDVRAVAALAELVGRDDPAILEAATATGRCLVTENVRDFAVLVRHAGHAGVLFVTAGRWPRTRSGLPRLANALHEAISDGAVPGANEVRWLA
jgi:predicted nuclease of predicted toxin-antitoxin system